MGFVIVVLSNSSLQEVQFLLDDVAICNKLEKHTNK